MCELSARSLDGAGCAGTADNWLSGVDRQLDEK
jgi:hypothetical protein